MKNNSKPEKQLPPTYYDILLKRPQLLEYVKKELDNLKDKALSVPFGSVDEYSKYFEDYIKNVVVKSILDEGFKTSGGNMELSTSVFNEFMKTPLFKGLMHSVHADYLTLTNFELFGRKSFYFNENLVSKLAYTNLNIDSDFLRLPFEFCLFIYTSKVAIESLYQFTENESNYIDVNTPISVFVMSKPAIEGKRKLVFACWHANHKQSYSFIKRELLIKDGWDISDSLKTDWGEIYKGDEEKETMVTPHEWIYGERAEDKGFYEKDITFFRIIINSILYLGSNSPDIIECLSPHEILTTNLTLAKSHAKRKKIKKEIAQTSVLNFSNVGQNEGVIIVDKTKNNNQDGNNITTSKKLTKRFIVRGHWRNQAYGESLSKRKLIWIEPYYKGPDMAELINRPYQVK